MGFDAKTKVYTCNWVVHTFFDHGNDRCNEAASCVDEDDPSVGDAAVVEGVEQHQQDHTGSRKLEQKYAAKYGNTWINEQTRG